MIKGEITNRKGKWCGCNDEKTGHKTDSTKSQKNKTEAVFSSVLADKSKMRRGCMVSCQRARRLS